MKKLLALLLLFNDTVAFACRSPLTSIKHKNVNIKKQSR